MNSKDHQGKPKEKQGLSGWGRLPACKSTLTISVRRRQHWVKTIFTFVILAFPL
jgi:hypothetical protein